MADTFTKKEVAEMMAAYTAITASLSEMLIKAGVLNREEWVNQLYHLLEVQAGKYREQPPSGRSAPLRHLIHLLELDGSSS
ncbi:hypothetical protein [Ochrobactrum sp. MC-1LL]|uniref:hypothetical protein n=1 Tax=Ochrobactrum sp. MC-1LL TaxID=2735351 RepID=UPI0014383EA7|nr:hypothetical protein [Ochrobactrum sp. MC-1LL]NKE77531.1 hypothetical protein [Ochrobactrum sp. MC-1LL]